jgi:type I restriction enzyme S subunit
MELKPGYKQTEVGVIPEDWTAVALEAVTTHIGDGLHGTPVYTRNADYYFINGNNLSNGKIIITPDTQAVDHKEFARHRKPLSNRSILMSINGTIGNLGLFQDQSLVLGKSAAYLNVRADVSKLYVYHVLQSSCVRQQFFDGLTGSTIGNLGLSAIRSTYIPLPLCDSEQTSIAKALGEADDLLYSLDQLLIKKRSVKQAVMQELLTGKRRLPGFEGEWVVKRLGDIAEITMGQSPISTNYNSHGRGMPLIQGNADIKNRETVERVFTTQITKRGFKGDILMSVRAPVGEVSRATIDVCLGRGVCAIRFPNNFLYHYLIFLEPTWAKHSKGSTFDSINTADLRAIDIHLPDESLEQIAISECLAQMDAELATLEMRLTKAHALKQGMMQQLLTGKIRLR